MHLQVELTSFPHSCVVRYSDKYIWTLLSTTWGTVKVIYHLPSHSSLIPFYSRVIRNDTSKFSAGENFSIRRIVKFFLFIFSVKAHITNVVCFRFSTPLSLSTEQILFQKFQFLLSSGFLWNFNCKWYSSRSSVSHVPVNSLLCSSPPSRSYSKAHFPNSSTAHFPNDFISSPRRSIYRRSNAFLFREYVSLSLFVFHILFFGKWYISLYIVSYVPVSYFPYPTTHLRSCMVLHNLTNYLRPSSLHFSFLPFHLGLGCRFAINFLLVTVSSHLLSFIARSIARFYFIGHLIAPFWIYSVASCLSHCISTNKSVLLCTLFPLWPATMEMMVSVHAVCKTTLAAEYFSFYPIRPLYKCTSLTPVRKLSRA